MLTALLLGALLAHQEAAAPVADALVRFEESLRPHPYLGRIVYTRIDDFAPFHFFIKRPDADEPGYYARIAEHYGPWFRELERLFTTQYVVPLGLERREEPALYPFFVLDSSGAYKDYADAERTFGLYAARAHYDPKRRLAVTFENAYQPESRSQHRHAALHELVHALVHAYYPEPEGMPRVAWFNEGLAEYLSYAEGLLPPAIYEKKPDPDALRLVASVSRVPGALQHNLFPIEELAALRDYADVEEHALARSGGTRLLLEGESATIGLFYAQSSLWTFYLHLGDGGRHKAAYMRYAASVWKGDGGPAALRRAFEDTELAELDRSFRKWLQETITRDLRVSVSVPREPERSSRPLEERPSVPSVRPFVAAELLPDPSDLACSFALALSDVRRGALAVADQRMVELAAGAPAELRERIERERRRLEDFRELRRRFFEHISRPNARKLDVELEGQKLVAQVTGIDGDRVRLGTNKRGMDELELDRLPVLAVAELARDKKYGFDPGPAAAWAYVLAGDPRWEKLVPQGDPLRADAQADYPQRIALGRAASVLVELAQAGAPGNVADAEAALAAVKGLAHELGELELVRERLPALRALARECLETSFGNNDLAAGVHGELEPLGDGRVRLSYAFDSPAELDDFTQDGYLESHSFGRPQSRFEIAGGKLVTRGFACMRSRLAFQGPQKIRVRARYSEPSGSFDPRLLFLLGCNDDGLVGFAASDLSGDLQVVDIAANYLRQTQGGGPLVLGESYQLELAFDGTTVTSAVNGSARGTIAAGPRTSGSVFLLSSSELDLALDELVIEGTPTRESIDRLRDAWVAARIAELGLE